MRRRRNFTATGAGAGPAADRGSAFVESIIAAAIVAMALGTTYRVIADSAARDRASEARRVALLIAQSELASVGADIPLAPGDTSGQSGDMTWRVEVSPYGAGGDKNPAGELLRVAVSVGPQAGGPNLVTLQSLRLGPGT
jgi:uncharacterized protein YcgI (DUF1989 family)